MNITDSAIQLTQESLCHFMSKASRTSNHRCNDNEKEKALKFVADLMRDCSEQIWNTSNRVWGEIEKRLSRYSKMSILSYIQKPTFVT